MTLESLLREIQLSAPYTVVLVFFAAYPIVTSIMWMITAMLFRWRWEDALPGGAATARSDWPMVSLLVPAHNEEVVIGSSVAAMLRIDYPDFEVIVIDDGSRDGTLAVLQPLLADPRLRIVHKPLNEGKQVAETTLSAIMGREAAYTGQLIQWDELLKSPQNLTPTNIALGTMPVPSVAMPGQTKVDRTWTGL